MTSRMMMMMKMTMTMMKKMNMMMMTIRGEIFVATSKLSHPGKESPSPSL